MEFLTTIIIAIVTFVLGYISGIYLPQKFRKDEQKPKISIGPFQERFNLFEITNHGGDLLQLSVVIKWLQDGKEEARTLTRFLNVANNPLRDRPHTPGSIKRSETKKASECPTYSDDGRVEVFVGGEDVSGQQYNAKFILRNFIKSEKRS